MIIALMMGTEMVPETFNFNKLTRLSAREEQIRLGYVSLVEMAGGMSLLKSNDSTNFWPAG
jgi:hypothetical protein